MGRLLRLVGYDHNLETKVRFTYIIAAFSILLVSLFLIFYILFVHSFWVNLITSLCILNYLLVLFLLRIHKSGLAKFFLIFGFLFQECFLVFYWFPQEANFNLFFFIVAPISFFIFDFQKRGERYAILALNTLVILLFLASKILPLNNPLIPLKVQDAQIFTILSAISTMVSIFIVFYYYSFNLNQTYRELNFLAETDSLTRIYNRRTLFREGRALYSFCRDFGKSYSVMILDVDHFKRVNDEHGHLEGDRVLCQVAELISGSVRREDTLSRYGGEEFAIILRDTSPELNLKIAENLRRKVEEFSFVLRNQTTLHLTVSIGVAILDEKHQKFDDLVLFADQAMYKAKQSGRNRVEAAYNLEESS